MPIYEFYCPDCHTVFSFLSKSVDTRKVPTCPKCGDRKLQRQISIFATTTGAEERGMEGGDGLDDARMERAITELAEETGHIDENDPKAAAHLMRKFSRLTGVEYGGSMKEVLERMEAGEDPETVETELGDSMDDDPFIFPEAKAGQKPPKKGGGRGVPRRDPDLYEM